MLKYIVKRVLYVIPVMLGVLVIVFASKTIMPGDPIDMILPPEATRQEREAKREELGLNDPIVIQFVNYVGGIVTPVGLSEHLIKQINRYSMKLYKDSLLHLFWLWGLCLWAPCWRCLWGYCRRSGNTHGSTVWCW